MNLPDHNYLGVDYARTPHAATLLTTFNGCAAQEVSFGLRTNEMVWKREAYAYRVEELTIGKVAYFDWKDPDNGACIRVPLSLLNYISCGNGRYLKYLYTVGRFQVSDIIDANSLPTCVPSAILFDKLTSRSTRILEAFSSCIPPGTRLINRLKIGYPGRCLRAWLRRDRHLVISVHDPGNAIDGIYFYDLQMAVLPKTSQDTIKEVSLTRASIVSHERNITVIESIAIYPDYHAKFVACSTVTFANHLYSIPERVFPVFVGGSPSRLFLLLQTNTNDQTVTLCVYHTHTKVFLRRIPITLPLGNYTWVAVWAADDRLYLRGKQQHTDAQDQIFSWRLYM